MKNINSYLVDSDNIFVKKSSSPISEISEMSFGSMPNDGSNLLLSMIEKNEILNEYPNAVILFKRFVGSQEFIRGEEKYCLWITDDLKVLAESIPPIKSRIEKCKFHRESSSREVTQKLAEYSYRFGEVRFKDTNSIIVPATSSERREYVPCGLLTNKTIISNSANAIYNAEAWLLGIVSSKMHMVWMRNVSGRLKTDYRYSATLCYNTFPFPKITNKHKEEISLLVEDILDAREKEHPKTLAELYDPDKMPEHLLQAHKNLDLYIEQCYRIKPFENDEERLAYLFKLYEKMIKKESTDDK